METGSSKTFLELSGRVIVKIDPKYFRPTEVDQLLGDASKARRELKWEPKIALSQGLKHTISYFKENLRQR